MTKYRILEIARLIPVLAVVIFWAVSCSGNRVSKTPFEEVKQAVAEASVSPSMQDGDDAAVRRLYGLDPADYEGVYLRWPLSNMDAEELLLIKLSDVSQGAAVKQAVVSRVDAQKKSFDGYGVTQFDLLQNHCVIEVRGNYVLFVVGEDAEAVRQAFLSAL